MNYAEHQAFGDWFFKEHISEESIGVAFEAWKARSELSQPIKPIRTKDRAPTEEDGEYVWGWTASTWVRGQNGLIRNFPQIYVCWLPLSALPIPEEE